jgi:poly-gamma-glutamate capsule biosynthesis protein CapA/YwtB (metallophosphatase superfamily)
MKSYALFIAIVLAAALAAAGLVLGPYASGPTGPRTLSIVFVGDTGMGESHSPKKLAARGRDFSFKYVQAALDEGDFVVANLETPFTQPDVRQQWYKKFYLPRHPLDLAATYRKHGFTAVSLANNHAVDYGYVGLLQTIDALEKVGIRPFGAGRNEPAARRPLILEKNGVRVGVLAAYEYTKPHTNKPPDPWYAKGENPGVARLSKRNLKADIAALKPKVDAVIVFPHWLKNYLDVLPRQKKFARFALTQGADAFIGHGSHTAQPAALVDGKPVLHSIGNFIWHAGGRYEKFDKQAYAFSLVTKVDFTRQGIRRITITPFFVDNKRGKARFVPRRVKPERARKLFDDLLVDLEGRWVMDGEKAVIEF